MHQLQCIVDEGLATHFGPITIDARVGVTGCGGVTITGMDDEIIPFRIDVAEAVLVDLRERLARTRWPDQLPGTGREYGADLATVQDLCNYWLHQYDWRRAEAELNAWPQFESTFDDTHVHFIHARPKHEDAMPLCLTHGREMIRNGPGGAYRRPIRPIAPANTRRGRGR